MRIEVDGKILFIPPEYFDEIEKCLHLSEEELKFKIKKIHCVEDRNVSCRPCTINYTEDPVEFDPKPICTPQKWGTLKQKHKTKQWE